jgi:YidC/Oxa1 family membrane protein insertase
MPFVQLPVFISFFAALREMGDYFPGYATGGIHWFTDLSVADPTMILPVCNALSFLLMIELGVDGMAKEQQGQFVWVMRALGVAMVPLTMDMPMGLFIYWNSNNILSIFQAGVMKQEGVREYLDIPKPPVNAPALKMRNPFATIVDGIKKEKAQSANVRAEIIDGSMPPPPPPSGAIPVTYSKPPKKKAIK